ncbi:pyridoxamine 5'-phosphate oxidase family protein [Nocardiopsis sp. MG754419]|uniref:pyridoxamine 5'-phosphate oxidase family protein n=1 Tax=Nocardiopsis sp. MG754419 TaxID=2259865 RepID=UPI001BAB7E94|nr:pyridoxamine 5'-phosphate oxidase family protein [Nocardiopsis sp. MG754419]MBR8744033.1 pyridoxamine 5'-phosphate oxidase family protein [Nocardiopsis sp. MG754419]
MAGTSGADASGSKRGAVAGPTPPPGQREASDDLAGTDGLQDDDRLLLGADLADDARSGFTVLERATCLNLLATRNIGRVAFTIDGDAAPTVLPVAYALINDTIVFRSTLAGTIMRYARGYAAFQVDQLDEERHEGWSVLCSGRCRWIRDDAEMERIPQGRLPQPWAAGPRDQILKIVPGRVSGREIHRS